MTKTSPHLETSKYADITPLTPSVKSMSMDSAAVPIVKIVPVKKTMSIPASRGGPRPASKASNRKKFIDFGGFNFRKTRTDQPWIQKNIPYKICHTFVANPTSNNNDGATSKIIRCCCGAEENEHEPGYTKDLAITEWSPDLHIRRHNGTCFGKIKFVEEDGTHQPDYVRISDDMLNKKSGTMRVMELLETRWRLPKPNLLISVTGGAQDFHCPPELEKRFKRGLAKAAKSTDAWITTGGTNTGVMKLVGEAVRGTSFGSQIVTIGVATWGIIKNREQLAVTNERKIVKDYETKESRIRRGAFLDPNHTHFLLVDNGKQYEYGGEIKFRAALEQKISERYREGNYTLPQICILIEGGPNSIKTLLETVKLGNPGLVIAGSGRSADVLAEAYRLSSPEEAIDKNGDKITIRVLSEVNTEDLNVVVSKKFPNMRPEDKDKIHREIIELLSYDKLLTIYELNDSKEFDLALLAALIRGNKEGTSSLASMKLAITWDRPNLAYSLILPSSKFSEKEKSDLLRIAIVQNKPVFIKMMLEQDLDMKHFLTHEMLASLYNEIDNTVVCFKTLRKMSQGGISSFQQGIKNKVKAKLSLIHIGMLLEEILEGTFQSTFTCKEFKDNELDMQSKPFENPYDVMVFYAVFVESQEMAKLFWERSRTPIATGLIACKILKFLAETQRNRLKRDEENERKLLEYAGEFESLAVGVMNQTFKDRNHQKELWMEVLLIKHMSLGNLDLVQLACTTEASNFIAQGAVQTLLTDIWLGQIHAAQHWVKIFIAACIPIAGPLFLMRYTKIGASSDPDLDGQNKGKEDPGLKEMDTQLELAALENGKEGEVETDGGQIPEEMIRKRKLTTWEKLLYFYNAPCVKFQYHVVMYLLFLGIFIYTLIFARPNKKDEYNEDKNTDGDWMSGSKYSGYEIYLVLYVISTIPIEIIQVVEQVPKTIRMKLWQYLQDLFNILDVLGIFCFLGGFIVKAFGDITFTVPTSGPLELQNAHHLLMILSFLMYSVRLIQLFRINSNMGPKIIMIGKMMIDLFFFIFLMIIFLIGYGVCAQALMNPNQGLHNPDSIKSNGSIVWDVIFRPYLHVFGELDLDGMYDELQRGHCPVGDETCDADTIKHDPTGQVHYYLVMCLLFVYLMFVNILLINLLIAIFSKSYEDIQADSDIVWKVQRSQMIQEYKDFPIFPLPLSLLYHGYTLVLFIFKSCMGLCREDSLDEDIDETAIYRVSMIEAESREEYQSKMEGEEEISTSSAYRDLKNELDAIKTMVRQGPASSSSNGQTPNPTNLPDQPPRPPPTASKQAKNGSRQQLDRTILSRLTKTKPLRVHMDSRKTPYPGSDVKRFILSDEKVSWFVRYPEYLPVDYTSPEIADQTSDMVDPAEITLKTKIQFNKINYSTVNNKQWTIDRTSHHGKYNVVDGIPQNPKGRTGVIGRGCLQRWGPNHAADTVVTRWHRDDRGEIMKIEGLPVLEFVGIFRQAFNEWAIPGGRCKPNERIFETIKREFSEEALANLSRPATEQTRISEMLAEHFKLGITVYKGYVDDPRNTDNAWIETIAVNYHDSTGKSFSKFPLQSRAGMESGSVGVQWIPIDHNLDLFANHEWIIEKVCYHRDAYNPITEPKRKETQVWMTGL
ncbi:transient receptor potential cation channel subfamily M member-like 2 isoform X10 [Bolinopsis microptera]|uniref:transient receptor potential cation channel subfamily M member-like 2 isoform X10 n=1 Tax=Bolinopsis microptera TaxID=2820187 RepID=UPI00307A18DC